MTKKLCKVISMGIVLALLLSAFAGCAKKENGGASNTGSGVTLNGDKIYPMQSEDILTYWMGLNVMIANEFENFGDTPLAKELERLTGAKFSYIHPQRGQENEQFRLMLTSNEISDIVQYGWNSYPGGPDMAISEGYIMALNDIFDEYMPALSDVMKNNPDVARKARTDGGSYYTVPFIRSEEWLTTYQGLILRRDWLQKAQLEPPKTIDSLENVLTVFKNEYSKKAPLVMTLANKNYFFYAYDMTEKFYLDGDTVKYGPAQAEYLEVLKKVKDWYDKGLIDNDIASADSAFVSSRVLNGDAGAYFGAIVGGMGVTLDAASEPGFDLVGVQQFSAQERDIPEFSPKEDNVNLGVGTAISAACKNVELAARFLDFGYTPEGEMLYNYGIEGVSYEMINGKPTLTELLTKNPDGLSITNVAPRYLRASYSGPFIQQEGYVEQSLAHPEQQRAAYETWSKTNMGKHLMPPLTLKADELDDESNIAATTTTYVDEMFIKFITGAEPLENFDKYIEQLKALGVEEWVAMYQDAYGRYKSR